MPIYIAANASQPAQIWMAPTLILQSIVREVSTGKKANLTINYNELKHEPLFT